MVLCVCHGHQLFGIGYHFKIFRSQVATGKKKLILHPVLGSKKEETRMEKGRIQ